MYYSVDSIIIISLKNIVANFRKNIENQFFSPGQVTNGKIKFYFNHNKRMLATGKNKCRI